ncbi:hypothetical protein Anas_11863 [Armadillidium nasatum]|uniref:Uncharacterized protein n=1 Tax=Armadillidium nasatum TaxID=96803 RepID=A0A5N5T514_9CRUS|nr:hypothetical protein Anas_11863 [Armadillidium nasatum]
MNTEEVTLSVEFTEKFTQTRNLLVSLLIVLFQMKEFWTNSPTFTRVSSQLFTESNLASSKIAINFDKCYEIRYTLLNQGVHICNHLERKTKKETEMVSNLTRLQPAYIDGVVIGLLLYGINCSTSILKNIHCDIYGNPNIYVTKRKIPTLANYKENVPDRKGYSYYNIKTTTVSENL